MGENLVFVLPDSLEDLLWSVPVMTQFLLDRYLMKRPPEKITAVCIYEQAHQFLRDYWKGINVVTELSSEEKQEADYIFDFDPEKAYWISNSTGYHITQGYGLLMGAMPMTGFPSVAMVIKEYEPGIVLLATKTWMERERIVWPHADEFVKLGLEQGIHVKKLPVNATWEEMRLAVSEAAVVVGIRSAATLMAAAMGKVVMEICPKDRHMNWASKWDCKRFGMFYNDLNLVTAEKAWERTKSLLAYLLGRGDLKWEARHKTSSGTLDPASAEEESVPMAKS